MKEFDCLIATPGLKALDAPLICNPINESRVILHIKKQTDKTTFLYIVSTNKH